MKRKLYLSFATLITGALLFSSCKKNGPEFCNCSPDNLVITSSVYAVGLNNPRGLKFGPDGDLYVAEGGIGGTNSTIGLCDQVPGAGPYTGSNTGSRISRIEHSGIRTTVAENIPSSTTSPLIGGFISGVADVAFIDHTLYGLLTGAGCSHGVPNIPNQVFKVNHDRTWTMVADISNFLKNNPVVSPDPADFEPDGTPYSMTSVDGELYITQPNQQEIDRISPKTGYIRRIIDISKSYPGPTNWIGPTSMIYHDGNFYFGTLTPFPFVQGAANVYKLTPDGKLSIFATGFTAILGITFDELGGLYVLENTIGHPFPTPGAGDIIRMDPSGERLTLASGLNLPTAMTFGQDNKLYVSIWGYGAPPGAGQIWQFDVTCAKSHGFKKNNIKD
jgi:hypothetical protein